MEALNRARGREADTELEFAAFFQATYPDLVRGLFLLTANVVEAEDLAQEAMARAYERWDRVAAMESPAGYVYRTAVNLNRKRVRHLAVRARRVRGLPREHDPSPAVDVYAELGAALASLPRKLREAFMLVEWFGVAPAEAGVVLGIKATSVRSRVSRARAALRHHLQEGVESRG